MKLQLSKKASLFFGVSIFLIALVILGMASFQKFDEKTHLENELALAEVRLQAIKPESLSSRQKELEEQLKQPMPDIEQAKADLSQPVSSTNATAAVFDAATVNDLAVTEITSSSPTNESVQGVILSGISITATVEGNLSKMVDFIATLSGSLKTMVIKSVDITIPEKTGGDNTTANIELVIYTYRGE